MGVTRFPNGLNTADTQTDLWEFGLPDPTDWHVYFNDFHTYTAGDWTITTTEAGAGSATEALTDTAFGALLITNAAGDNDRDFFNKVGESFLLTAGKKLFFKARFKVSDATQSDFVMGLQITDTTPLDVTDGIFFQKDDGDDNLDFHVEKNNTATSASDIATVADDTYLTVGFYYDGGVSTETSIKYFVNEAHVGTSVNTNMPDDEELTISFGIQNGAAAAKTMTVDYIFAAVER
jgi:hypothetical protein